MKPVRTTLAALWMTMVLAAPGFTQSPPSDADTSQYDGLHLAAHRGDEKAITKLSADGADLEARDGSGRTPLHVAAYGSHEDAVQALAKAGANLNALEGQAYDIVTIAAVARDFEMVDLALSLGAKAGNVTSPYEGTALIASAHLGHHKIVRRLIAAGAPLDHVNNLGWTALIEAVILGDGGPDHIATVRALVEADADRGIADREGRTPLDHARSRGYAEIIRILEAAQ